MVSMAVRASTPKPGQHCGCISATITQLLPGRANEPASAPRACHSAPCTSIRIKVGSSPCSAHTSSSVTTRRPGGAAIRRRPPASASAFTYGSSYSCSIASSARLSGRCLDERDWGAAPVHCNECGGARLPRSMPWARASRPGRADPPAVMRQRRRCRERPRRPAPGLRPNVGLQELEQLRLGFVRHQVAGPAGRCGRSDRAPATACRCAYSGRGMPGRRRASPQRGDPRGRRAANVIGPPL